MHYSKIKNCDIANGSGVRVSLFVSGCLNHCKNCFQPETWDFEYGDEFTDETLEALIAMLDKSYIAGLTLLGGEPFEPENQRGLLPLVKAVRSRLPEKNIWAYTGFTYEQLRGVQVDAGEPGVAGASAPGVVGTPESGVAGVVHEGRDAQDQCGQSEERSRGRCEVTDELISMLDVLVDGRFVEELKDISLKFRGSSNQRLIDVPATLAKGEVVCL